MAEIAQVQVALSGWPGGPGVNTFYMSRGTVLPGWDDAVDAFVGELENVYDAMRPYVVDGWTATFTNVYKRFDVATGVLIAVGAYDGPDPITDLGSAINDKLSRADQLVAGYNTDTVHSGRLIRGRNFLGPISSAAIGEDGYIPTGVRTTIQNAYNALVSGTGPRLAVWSQPRAGFEGAYGDVTGVVVARAPGVLRGRRD